MRKGIVKVVTVTPGKANSELVDWIQLLKEAMFVYSQILMNEVHHIGDGPFSHSDNAQRLLETTVTFRRGSFFLRERAATSPALPDPATKTESTFIAATIRAPRGLVKHLFRDKRDCPGDEFYAVPEKSSCGH